MGVGREGPSADRLGESPFHEEAAACTLVSVFDCGGRSLTSPGRSAAITQVLAAASASFSPDFWAVVAAVGALLGSLIPRTGARLRTAIFLAVFGASLVLPAIVLALGHDSPTLRLAGVALVASATSIVAGLRWGTASPCEHLSKKIAF